MNRVIAQIGIPVVMLLLVACDWDIMDIFKGKDLRLTDFHHIINTSGNKMIHVLTFELPLEDGDSTLRHFSDGSNAQEELEWVVSYNVGPINAHPQLIISYKFPFYLYNINDTTSLKWTEYWREYDDTLKNFCPFYRMPVVKTSDDKEVNRESHRYLVVSDSLLSLMQKDYAMLDKFKEYYANE